MDAKEKPDGSSRPGRAIDNELLAVGLGVAAIVERGELPALGSAAREIVTCRMPDNSKRRLLCKFGPLAGPAGASDHFGLGYEAQVYDEVLHAWPDDVPPLHGVFLDEASQTLVLAVEHLEGGEPLDHVSPPKAGLLAAARWIARFHTWGESAAVPAFLRRYDTEYFRAALRRASDSTRPLHDRFPWLPALCERGMRQLPALLPPATIIHGDYQAKNILVQQGRSVPTNWESAALAAGEFDLANITLGGDDDMTSLCEQQYCLVRWPERTPDDFALRLTAARVFLRLRRLADEGNNDPETAAPALDELAPLARKFMEAER